MTLTTRNGFHASPVFHHDWPADVPRQGRIQQGEEGMRELGARSRPELESPRAACGRAIRPSGPIAVT